MNAGQLGCISGQGGPQVKNGELSHTDQVVFGPSGLQRAVEELKASYRRKAGLLGFQPGLGIHMR